jgi:NAD+ diphosphatase
MSARERPNFFAGAYVDRRAELREAADWLAAAREDPRTLYLPARGTAHLLELAAAPRVAFLTGEHPLVRGAQPHQLVLLGWFRGERCVLLELAEDTVFDLPAGQGFEELRPLSMRLGEEEAGLLAYARALSIWRARHRHCGVCAAPMRADRAGHVLRCSNPDCNGESFPRIDPAIIVLVTDGERALLGRQASWPAGRYSTLAGFVEPGESLEDAVVREVFEETGVQVRDVQYQSSQPWPFPSSIMLGYRARADVGAAVRVTGELEDARWFSREELEHGTAVLPTRQSISYRLIHEWLEDSRREAGGGGR